MKINTEQQRQLLSEHFISKKLLKRFERSRNPPPTKTYDLGLIIYQGKVGLAVMEKSMNHYYYNFALRLSIDKTDSIIGFQQSSIKVDSSKDSK